MKPTPTLPIQTNRALLYFLNYHRITMISLAHNLSVKAHIIHIIVRGYPVDAAFAQRIADECTRLSGKRYTIEDLGLCIQTAWCYN